MTASLSPAPPAEPRRSALDFAVALWIIGLIVCVYGIGLSVLTGLEWARAQPPGTVMGPPTAVQAFQLRIEQGIYVAAFGGVLLFVATLLERRARQPGPQAGSAHPRSRWHGPLVVSAALLVLAVPALGFVPPPQRVIAFSTSDFRLAPFSVDAPYEFYLVSHTFPAAAHEDFFPYFDAILRDNRTGAVVEEDRMVSSYVKGQSDSYARPQFGGAFLAATTGPYVVVVRSSFCASLASPPCANATVEATGNLTITSPEAYIPLQLGLGVVGSACAVAALVQSGLGSRRTTS